MSRVCYREQSDREQALEDFKTGRARILIATDVASRGLDIKDITYVTQPIWNLCTRDDRPLAARQSAP